MNCRFFYALILFAGVLACGCADAGKAPEGGGKSSADGTAQAEPGKMPGTSDPHSPPTPDGEKADLAALKKAQADAEAAFNKATADAKAKKAFIDATVKLATETMYHPDLAPREKYSAALKLYRLVLKTDPENQEAKTNAKMIEDIYRDMGRPIPQ